MTSPSKQVEVTITDAALRLGVSREVAVRMVQKGVLKGHRHPDGWYATRRSVERYLAKQQQAAAS